MPDDLFLDRKKRVLIIDDQPFMLKLIQFNLKKHGYDTVTEVNGLKALTSIEEISPDLIILDIRMPNITGTDLCRKFRENKQTANIPIIMLTGQLPEDSENESLESGATDFMTKPFSPTELAAKVKHYIG